MSAWHRSSRCALADLMTGGTPDTRRLDEGTARCRPGLSCCAGCTCADIQSLACAAQVLSAPGSWEGGKGGVGGSRHPTDPAGCSTGAGPCRVQHGGSTSRSALPRRQKAGCVLSAGQLCWACCAQVISHHHADAVTWHRRTDGAAVPSGAAAQLGLPYLSLVANHSQWLWCDPGVGQV